MAQSAHRITFIHAPEDHYDQNYGTQFIPLWAYCLAAHVPDSRQISMLDLKNQNLSDCGPADVFAFSGINQDVQSIRAAWELLKGRYPEAIFILGGPITWSFEQEGKLGHLDYFDHLFILDGEEPLPEFLDGFATGRPAPKVIRGRRFPMEESRRLRFDLLRPGSRHYYGAVIEYRRRSPPAQAEVYCLGSHANLPLGGLQGVQHCAFVSGHVYESLSDRGAMARRVRL